MMWVCVTFFWMGVDGGNIFLGGCGWVRHFSGWVWVSVTFVWVGVAGCDIFLGWCGWV